MQQFQSNTHSIPGQQASEAMACLPRIGERAITLDDLRALHAYREAVLRFDHHLAIHDLGEHEHARHHDVSDAADDLMRLRAEEEFERREEARHDFDMDWNRDWMANADFRVGDLVDVTGWIH